ncbi:MAG: hypothetical protein R2820_02770 [Cyclobacteriaceae bacterium]
MKATFVSLIIMGFHFQIFAQRPDYSKQCKDAMNELSYFIGDWKGQANVMTQNGELIVDQTERIESALGGVAILIEGIGRVHNEIEFNALGIINFDPFTKQYKLRSYLKEGLATDAYFKVLEPNKYEWGFDAQAAGKFRYTIKIDPSKRTWNEVGEMSRDGNAWMKIIELNLVKK